MFCALSWVYRAADQSFDLSSLVRPQDFCLTKRMQMQNTPVILQCKLLLHTSRSNTGTCSRQEMVPYSDILGTTLWRVFTKRLRICSNNSLKIWLSCFTSLMKTNFCSVICILLFYKLGELGMEKSLDLPQILVIPVNGVFII